MKASGKQPIHFSYYKNRVTSLERSKKKQQTLWDVRRDRRQELFLKNRPGLLALQPNSGYSKVASATPTTLMMPQSSSQTADSKHDIGNTAENLVDMADAHSYNLANLDDSDMESLSKLVRSDRQLQADLESFSQALTSHNSRHSNISSPLYLRTEDEKTVEVHCGCATEGDRFLIFTTIRALLGTPVNQSHGNIM